MAAGRGARGRGRRRAGGGRPDLRRPLEPHLPHHRRLGHPVRPAPPPAGHGVGHRPRHGPGMALHLRPRPVRDPGGAAGGVLPGHRRHRGRVLRHGLRRRRGARRRRLRPPPRRRRAAHDRGARHRRRPRRAARRRPGHRRALRLPPRRLLHRTPAPPLAPAGPRVVADRPRGRRRRPRSAHRPRGRAAALGRPDRARRLPPRQPRLRVRRSGARDLRLGAGHAGRPAPTWAGCWLPGAALPTPCA